MAGKSKDSQLWMLRDIILAMMKREGRSVRWCEVSSHPIKGKFSLHHERYEGDTYQDLKISCYPCNLKAENKFLD